jgi:alpha-amylase/alpha-mannosidase (GH57 family)
MGKFACIHGHFYQPPRENPWLEAVEFQESASPYHDWNERVTAECYAPNAYARVLNGDGRIEEIVSNYSRISFNFGPTLLSWMKEKAADVHQAIIDADNEGQKRFAGHGPALAQCYNHIIMPLSNRRDKITQVIWGIRDFESRFGRKPEGMWLPETAADNETLAALAKQGIQFTILSPYQASRVRPLRGGEWQDVNGGKIDPSMPYRVNLPSGLSISVYFYDAPIARAVAFERLLTNGDNFAKRLTGAFAPNGDRDQLANIATDGESYGHHFVHGEMALAYALHSIEIGKEVSLTNYGEYLETHPPTHEVEIHQASAWSCSHGVDRWKRNCGCNSGGRPGWNQEWRAPLREALDWLRDQLAQRYEKLASASLKDPWAARDDYIAVILDRSPENIARFFGRHATRELNEADQIACLRLLEMQRHALLMYTSCGWFFDELSGLETVQVIQYAARAIQLARDLFDEDLETGFLELLEKAKSNIPEHKDGRVIYDKFVKPAVVTRESVGAHYAISSLFESYPEQARIYAFSITQEDRQLFTAGNTRLAVGRIKVTFENTRSSDLITYAVIHMGEHNLNCGVRYDGELEVYKTLVTHMHEAFKHADFAEIIRLMDRHFGSSHYSLKNLFRDEQTRILSQILATTRDDIYNTYRLITDRYASLDRFLADLHAPPLKGLELAMEIVLNSELRRQFDSDHLDPERVRSLLAEGASTRAGLDKGILAYALKGHLDRLSDRFLKAPQDAEVLQNFFTAAELVHHVPFEVNMWKPQNICHSMVKAVLPAMRHDAENHDDKAKAWVDKFLALREQLGFHNNGNTH